MISPPSEFHYYPIDGGVGSIILTLPSYHQSFSPHPEVKMNTTVSIITAKFLGLDPYIITKKSFFGKIPTPGRKQNNSVQKSKKNIDCITKNRINIILKTHTSVWTLLYCIWLTEYKFSRFIVMYYNNAKIRSFFIRTMDLYEKIITYTLKKVMVNILG